MRFRITQVLQWARRVRDFLVEHPLKSEVAELTTFRQQLDEVIVRLTANAATQEAVTKQSRVQTTEIRRLRRALREGQMKPIVRASRTMPLQIDGTDITFVLPDFRVDHERLASAGDAMVTALKVVGPEFVANGFAPNFVEQLSNTTKALRDAIDLRAAHVSRRTGVTAAMERDGAQAVQLVRVLDTLVRPVINADPELLAAWDNVVQIPRTSTASGVVATPAVVTTATTSPATTPAATGEAAQGHQHQTA